MNQFTVRKSGDNFAIYFQGKRAEGPLHATRQTANRYARLMESERNRRLSVRCDQCAAAMINGAFCHETGCPNARKTWIPEREQWVLFLKCRECGSDVESGESCDCQTPVDESCTCFRLSPKFPTGHH